MKRTALLLLVFLVSVLFAQNPQVSLSDIQTVADRNAREMWGNRLGSATPIPYYGPDDKIIAWHFNYAIDKAFPDDEALKQSCDDALASGNRELGQGVDEYANMVIGANRDMPVIIQCSKGLSQQYYLGEELKRIAAKEFSGSYELLKSYYLGFVDVWHCVSDGTTKKYINLYPPTKIVTDTDFQKGLQQGKFFWQDDDGYEEEWASFLDSGQTTGRNIAVIPGEPLMPFTEWSFGCVPTAAAMVLCWYDNYMGYGDLVENYFTRTDAHTGHTLHHVPSILPILAQQMDTSAEGNSDPWWIDDGFINTIESRGYTVQQADSNYGLQSHQDFFNMIKTIVDAGYPCLATIPADSFLGIINTNYHTVTAVGYNTSPALVYIHDSNFAAVMQITRSMLEGVFWAFINPHPEVPAKVKITAPNGGDAWYSSGGERETVHSGDIIEITWDTNIPESNSHAKLFYHVDGGNEDMSDWVQIMPNQTTANDGSYHWTVPDINSSTWGTSSEYVRVKIIIYDDTTLSRLAADGSYGDFTILARTTGLPILGSSVQDITETPDYFAKSLNLANTWGVIGVRDNRNDNLDGYGHIANENLWKLELYDDITFDEKIAESSYGENTNYIVIDNYHVPPNNYGVKLRSNTSQNLAWVQSMAFPGNILQTGQTYTKTWSDTDVVEIYNVYLGVDRYHFRIDNTTITSPLDYALYKAGGDGIFSYTEAVASDRRNLLATEDKAFTYNSTSAGWYGLVVSSKYCLFGAYNISIMTSSKWLGNNPNWHDPTNWSMGFVPTNQWDVIIPSGCQSYPVINDGSTNAAIVKSMTIEDGAGVFVTIGTLSVAEDLRLFGNLQLSNASSRLYVGSVIMESGSILAAGSTSQIYCSGSWHAMPGSATTFVHDSKVILNSSQEAQLRIDSNMVAFNYLTIYKTGGAEVLFNENSQADLIIKNTFRIETGSTFTCNSSRKVELRSLYQNYGSVHFDNGTLRFAGDHAYLASNPGDYYHSIEVCINLNTQLPADVHINGDLTITRGGLIAGDKKIYLGGDWKNNNRPSGFQKGTGTVIFNGDGEQRCFGEDFYNLEIASPTSELTFVSGTSTCVSYNWTSGALIVNGGILTVNDLFDNGLHGTYQVNSGELHLNQNSTAYNDLNGEIIIHGGLMTVSGGTGVSQWGAANSARIEMSDGVLDFQNSSISIAANTQPLEENISGGTIRTTGNYTCYRSDFQPGGGTIEMYGAGDSYVMLTALSQFPNLKINKAASRNQATSETGSVDPQDTIGTANEQTDLRVSTVTLHTNITVYGSLMLTSGTLKLNGYTVNVEDEMEVSGYLLMTSDTDLLNIANSLYWYAGATGSLIRGEIRIGGWLEIFEGSSFLPHATNTIRFIGSDTTMITNHAIGSRLGSVLIDKGGLSNNIIFEGPVPVTVVGNLTINNLNGFTVHNYDLTVNGNVTADTGSDLEISNLGRLLVGGNFSAAGNVMVEGAALICNHDFTLSSGGNLNILDSGSCILQKPYTGQMFGLVGNVNIAEYGVLEITHNGLQIGSTRNISLTGGTIKVGWGFSANNPNTFWAENGTLEFIGARQATILMGSGNYVRDLIFNKPGVTYGVQFQSNVNLKNDLTVLGGNPNLNGYTLSVGRDVLINGGRLTANNAAAIINVGRNWSNNVGVTAFEEGSGTVNFYNSPTPYNGTISTETFNYLNINKATAPNPTVVQTAPGSIVTAKNILNANTGELIIGENATLRADSNINVYGKLSLGAGSILNMNHTYIFSVAVGGRFNAIGTLASPAKLTSDAGYYAFSVNSGGTIAAQYCIFEKMNIHGINIANGSTIDPQYFFHHCTFQNGASGGTLLKKYNSQASWIDSPIFPTNTWGGSYNVYHTPSSGSLDIQNASGGFFGAAYEDDPEGRIFWTNLNPNPTVAHSPQPANNASGILTTTMLSWEYTSTPNYVDPIGYIVKMGTDPTMNVCQTSYKMGGPGTHQNSPLLALVTGTTYYWQIIPTTDPQSRYGETELSSSDSGRGAAIDCPVWSFSTTGSLPIISTYPYLVEFENGAANWTSGAISGANHWQWGVPTAAPMNTAHSGAHVWATYLSQNYADNANTWLKSPPLNFSVVSAPNLSVWLHLNCELNYDGMILESSIDNGSTWQKVVGDPGFYNNTTSAGPLPANKWSGQIGVWTQYSTNLTGLAYQSLVYLRFRFASDSSVNHQGMAVDDVRIWDANAVTDFSWTEDFTGVTAGTLPAGWESTHNNWSVQSSNAAGGSAPEMRFNDNPYTTGNFYLKSPALNTSGCTELTLSFKQFANHYTTPYTLKLMSIVGSTEYLIQEWVNPTAHIGAGTFSFPLTVAGHGVGASDLRLAWVFSGYSYNINQWYLDDISLTTMYPYPSAAHTPVPATGVTLVPLTTQLGWTYTSSSGHPDPIGYRLRMGTSPTLASYQESYTAGGPGTYLLTPIVGLAPATTYYWQVLPTTSARAYTLDAASTFSSSAQRSDAVSCPIWSFSTAAAQQITSYPYLQDFEGGSAGWNSGAAIGNDHWQIGTPGQTTLNSAHSGTKAWMTYLTANYQNLANTWLKSPPLNFSSLNAPNFSVWLNVWCESNWDGMILESSVDGGSSWQYVSGEAGFYNNNSGWGPLIVDKWSGMNGAWLQYSTSLSGLANQELVYLRFRFATDDSGVYEGIALDDIQIWNQVIPPTVAHTPIPANAATGVAIDAQLGWTYTSTPPQSDPLGYIVKGGTDPLLNSFDVTHVSGGPGTYSIPVFFDVSYNGTYYWQVIPTTETYTGLDPSQLASADTAARSTRTNALNCPIWSFTVESAPLQISTFPYAQDFEAGAGGWNSGAITGTNHWQMGTPAQAHLNAAHSGTNAWMTYLSQNYENNANTWLKSPSFDFSALSNPFISVWINHWSETNYDGMILESSIDGGSSWQYVSGDAGFYSSSLPYGPIAAPKWSGVSGSWVEYSSKLTGLAHYPLVHLRFRFASDETIVLEGIALDDINIWDNQSPFFAVSPTSWDFGSLQTEYVTTNQEFQISNLGAGTIALEPTDIQIIGANADEFILVNIPEAVSLGAGQSVVISTRFAPQSAGNKSAMLQIDDNLGITRDLSIISLNPGSREAETRDLHQVPLSGTGLAPLVLGIPLAEDFGRSMLGALPDGWESTTENWSIQNSDEAGGTLPEAVFNGTSVSSGNFYLKSPRINTVGMSQLALSFKHHLNHAAGNYTLKVLASVGSNEYLIQQWINPSANIPAQTLQFTLDSTNHGVGAADLRIIWVFSGNSQDIDAWHIDDIVLDGIVPSVTTGSATNISTQSAILNAVITNAGSTTVSARGFYYGIDPDPVAWGTSISSTDLGVAFSAMGSGLASGTQVFYCGYADNSFGRGYGSLASFTTLSEAVEAPQNLTITIGMGSITLSWNSVPNASGYKVFSANAPDGTFVEDFSGVFTGPCWTAPIPGSIKFYQVKAISGSASGFVQVPAGTFTMGRTSGSGDPDELPTHSVTLSGFLMGKYEVTQREWQDVMGNNPASGYGVGDLYPVYNVSWYSMLKYCNLRSLGEGLVPAYSINGTVNPADWGPVPIDFDPTWDAVICNWNANGYRLPTEAEWEYAARGATNNPDYLYAGSNDIDAVAWYYQDGSPEGNKPIGGKTANGLGIYDMSGNANELCWDLMGDYSAAPAQNPTGAISGFERIRRGGFWDTLPIYCRVVQRDSSYPFVANRNLGFRLCKSGGS